MSMHRLREIQHELLGHLTDPRRFGTEPDQTNPVGVLAGIDPQALSLLGNLSFNKRMQKIGSVLSLTFEHLVNTSPDVVTAFASAYPPDTDSAMDNAAQFFDYLKWQDKHTAPFRPFIVDLARLELAFARVRARSPSGRRMTGEIKEIRRARHAEFLDCDFDVQNIVEVKDYVGEPRRWPTYLVVTWADGDERPSILELDSSLFRLAENLVRWTRLDEPTVPLDLTRNLDIERLIQLAILDGRP